MATARAFISGECAVPPRLERIRGYEPPESGHPMHRQFPFSGRKFVQKLVDADGRSFSWSGCTLRNQCQVLSDSGSRCRHATKHDYTMCTRHLLLRRHLRVFPSRICGAGEGLFAVMPSTLIARGLIEGRPSIDRSVVVFKKGEQIGGETCTFLGELITDEEMYDRYPDPNGGDYSIPIDDDFNGDESFARTVLSYSNDAIVLTSPNLSRRGRYRVNARADMKMLPDGREAMFLSATRDLRHGEEILWSYSGTDDASKTRRDWKREPDGTISDQYWSAANHGPN